MWVALDGRPNFAAGDGGLRSPTSFKCCFGKTPRKKFGLSNDRTHKNFTHEDVFDIAEATPSGTTTIKKGPAISNRPFKIKPSDYLLSRTVARVVPSALRSLTTVFGMGTGVTPSVWSLGIYVNNCAIKENLVQKK